MEQINDYIGEVLQYVADQNILFLALVVLFYKGFEFL
jgi:hypothetical protein